MTSERTVPVSLILTTYNEARSIVAFFSSVGKQNLLPAEVVLCDGGSDDDTLALASSIVIEDVEIILIQRTGSNIAAGRNAAIAAARHDVVAVSDAGCLLPPDWLQRIAAPLLRDQSIDVVGGGYGYIADTRFERVAAAAEIDVDDLDPETFLPSSRSVAFRKSAWSAVGGYPEELSFAGEDTAFCLALLKTGHRMALAREARALWRPRASLSAYVSQHYLYGVGDGEAGVKRSFYLKILVKHGCCAALLGACTFVPLLFLPWALLLLGYALRIRRLYRWKREASAIWLPAFALIAVKEWCVFAGFLRGTIRRRPARET